MEEEEEEERKRRWRRGGERGVLAKRTSTCERVLVINRHTEESELEVCQSI